MGSVDITEPFLPMWSFFSAKVFWVFFLFLHTAAPSKLEGSITYHAFAYGMVCETPPAQVLDKIM